MALLSGPARTEPLPSSIEIVGSANPTHPVDAFPASTRDYTASPKDVAAATVIALEKLGFNKAVISTDHGDVHVSSTRVMRTIVHHLEGYTFTISRIRQARVILNSGGCSTAVDVSFDAAKLTWDGGSLMVGDRAAPLSEFFNALDRQLRVIQGSSGEKAWLDSCPKPPPLPVL